MWARGLPCQMAYHVWRFALYLWQPVDNIEGRPWILLKCSVHLSQTASLFVISMLSSGRRSVINRFQCILELLFIMSFLTATDWFSSAFLLSQESCMSLSCSGRFCRSSSRYWASIILMCLVHAVLFCTKPLNCFVNVGVCAMDVLGANSWRMNHILKKKTVYVCLFRVLWTENHCT